MSAFTQPAAQECKECAEAKEECAVCAEQREEVNVAAETLLGSRTAERDFRTRTFTGGRARAEMRAEKQENLQEEMHGVLSKASCRHIYEKYRWAINDGSQPYARLLRGENNLKHERWLLSRERDKNMREAWQQEADTDGAEGRASDPDFTLLTKYEAAYRERCPVHSVSSTAQMDALRAPEPGYAERAKAELAHEYGKAAAGGPQQRGDHRPRGDGRLICLNGAIDYATERYIALEAVMGNEKAGELARHYNPKATPTVLRWAWRENHMRRKQEALDLLTSTEHKAVASRYRAGLRLLLQGLRRSELTMMTAEDTEVKHRAGFAFHDMSNKLRTLREEQARNFYLASTREADPAAHWAPFMPDYEDLQEFEMTLDPKEYRATRAQTTEEEASMARRIADGDGLETGEEADPLSDCEHGYDLHMVHNHCPRCKKIEARAAIAMGTSPADIQHITTDDCGGHEHEDGKGVIIRAPEGTVRRGRAALGQATPQRSHKRKRGSGPSSGRGAAKEAASRRGAQTRGRQGCDGTNDDGVAQVENEESDSFGEEEPGSDALTGEQERRYNALWTIYDPQEPANKGNAISVFLRCMDENEQERATHARKEKFHKAKLVQHAKELQHHHARMLAAEDAQARHEQQIFNKRAKFNYHEGKRAEHEAGRRKCTAPRNEACQLIEALLASFQLQRPEREPEAAAHSVAENNANSDPEAQPEALAENKDNDN